MTPRIVLTSFRLLDAPSINRWKNDPALQAASGERATGESLAQTEARIRRWQASDPLRIVHFAIRLGEDESLLGFCHLAEIEPDKHACKVGIVIGDRQAWGKGYGRAALTCLLAEASQRGLTRVLAEVHTDNERSARLFASSGFSLIGKQAASGAHGQSIEELLYVWNEG